MDIAWQVLNNAISVRDEYIKLGLYESGPGADQLGESLSSKEIADLLAALYLSAVPVVAYSDIFNEKTARQHNFIRSYLNSIPQRAAVFLYRQTENYGHWCCMFEHPTSGELYIFDSYGKERPDEYITGTRTKKGPYNSAALGQSAPYLLECINNSDYPYVIWNDYPLQYLNPGIQTCGKWCVLRLLNRFATEKEFYEYYNSYSAVPGYPKDYRRDIAAAVNYYLISSPAFIDINRRVLLHIFG